MLIIDGVDLDHLIAKNINNLLPFFRQFNLHERSYCGAQINGGILDLVITFVMKHYSVDFFTL